MSLPRWLRTNLREVARNRVLLALVVAGVLCDQVLRAGAIGVGTALLITALGAGLVFTVDLSRTECRLLVPAAIAFGAWTGVRASPWLAWPDVGASLGLLLAAASLRFEGSAFNLGASEALARIVSGGAHLVLGLEIALQPLRRAWPRLGVAWPAIRGIAIALPIVAVVGWLLASADPVFASFFELQLDPAQVGLDCFYVLVGAAAMAGILRIALAEPIGRVDGPRRRLGFVESVVVVSALDAVFAIFAIAQVVAASAAGQGTLRAAGVTYAEYARSGFFQLLYVAAITLVVLVTFNRIASLDRRRLLVFRALTGTAIVLTLLIVYVAFRRLSLYEDAYGFTMLRLYSHLFAGWIAAVFLLLGVELIHQGARSWFLGASAAALLALLLGLNAVNPEALVVQLNTGRAISSHKLDVAYLATLSADSTPALADAQRRLPADLAAEVSGLVCRPGHSPTSWAATTLAGVNAASVRRTTGC